MARKVVLHIGAMKSGTSFLQQKLLANHDLLLEQGVLFPGRAWRGQVTGVQDVLGRKRDGVKREHTVGAWQRIVDEVQAWEGTAVISVELLASARGRGIGRVVESFAPAEVQVVLTARDLGRQVPAMWQEGVQNFATWSWEDYLHGIEHGDPDKPGPAKTFWKQQDLPFIVRKWLPRLEPDAFTLVTLPPPGSDPQILWQRFCSVAGLADVCYLPGRRTNESLGAVSAELMRRLNLVLAEREMTWAEYTRLVKRGLAKQALAARKDDEPAIGFHGRWVKARAARMVEELAALPIRVVGDLDELTPVRVRGVNPSRLKEGDHLDAALHGLVRTLEMWAADRRRLARRA